MEDLEQRYQLPEDIQPAGTVTAESELIDFVTGVSLVDANTQEILTGDTFEAQALASAGNCIPIVISNDAETPAPVDIVNRQQSEVEVSLLGIPRSETALNLFSAVNIYGVNTKEWAQGPVVASAYQYYRDPSEWTFDGDYGYYWRHLPAESAVQAYAFPPPTSFVYSTDDGSGRFPGGYTDGVITTYWESKRAFRYQPGRVTGFTLGVRMSTETNTSGEIIQWGCRNSYGDGYYFQLERGTDLYIVRTSPDLGTLKVARADWNGDPLLVGEGTTGWGLDLSRVTMFKIEFSWYGAVGANFYAYVPAGNGEARWVRLHRIFAENQFTVPSLRSAYLRMFTLAKSVAGATKPTFINLYGSSVYIDGGDKGTVTVGSAALTTPKNIDSTGRSILGINVKNKINDVDNQKAVYPVGLAAYASVPARIDLIFKSAFCRDVQYGYGAGTSLSRGSSSSFTVTKIGGNQLTIASGTFPDISAELSGSTNYLTGRRVKVVGTNIFNTHVVSINPSLTTITTDRPIPDGTASIRLARFNANAVGNATISSGVIEGTIYRRDNTGFWRLGLWPQASGTYNENSPVLWFASSYPGLRFNRSGVITGELQLPRDFGGCNDKTSFAVVIDSGSTSYTITASSVASGLTVNGSTNPWPIAVVAELLDGATISDITIAETSVFDVVGSGAIKAVPSFTVSGLTESSTAAGGTSYVAHKFENSLSDPLSAVMVDTQGYKVITPDSRVATYFIGSGESKQFDLSNLFGPDKMYITGPPGSEYNSGALFVVATARAGSGVASATLNWEEQ